MRGANVVVTLGGNDGPTGAPVAWVIPEMLFKYRLLCDGGLIWPSIRVWHADCDNAIQRRKARDVSRGKRITGRKGEQMAMVGTYEVIRDIEIRPDEVGKRRSRCRWLDFAARFIHKEFGSSWEEQYQEYDEFWRDYFTTPSQN